MNTNMAQTSVTAYHDHVASGAKLKQREAIMDYMEGKGPATRRQIARNLEFELGATAGRVNKLVADGLLIDRGTIKCSTTNKTVGLVGLPETQGELFLSYFHFVTPYFGS